VYGMRAAYKEWHPQRPGLGVDDGAAAALTAE